MSEMAYDKCSEEIEKLLNRHGETVFAVCIYIYYTALPPLAQDILSFSVQETDQDKLKNKKLFLDDAGYPTNTFGDIITPQYWQKIKGAVNKCGDQMQEIIHRYKIEDAAVAIASFYNNIPENLMLTVMRLEYLNTQEQESMHEIASKFKQKLPPRKVN